MKHHQRRRTLCAAAFSRKLCSGRVSSIPNLHVNPDQSNPSSGIIPNVTPNPNPVGGSRASGAGMRLRRVYRVFRWRLKRNIKAGRPKYLPRPIRSAFCTTLCRMQLHVARVIRYGFHVTERRLIFALDDIKIADDSSTCTHPSVPVSAKDSNHNVSGILHSPIGFAVLGRYSTDSTRWDSNTCEWVVKAYLIQKWWKMVYKIVHTACENRPSVQDARRKQKTVGAVSCIKGGGVTSCSDGHTDHL